jgi:hypothetical protein
MDLAPSTLAQWAGAMATSAAVLVALFRDWLLGLFWYPNLSLRILPEPPDYVKTPIQVGNTSGILWTGDAYFLRLWIENTGNRRAEKVQVFVSKVLREQADRSFKPVPGFLPMNLRWSNTDFNNPEIYADGISPQMGKHCDLASISDPKNPTLISIPSVPAGQVTLDLWLEVFPATLSHGLSPGTYKIELTTAGSNCEPEVHRIMVNVTGRWFDDERTMFSQGVGVKRLD